MNETDRDSDIIASAIKNRAISKRLFQQLQIGRDPQSILIQPNMLHRTPSGARKRIRQRQEQRWLRAISGNNVEQQSSSVNETEYRSVVDAGEYKSILPEEPSFLTPPAQRSHSMSSSSFASNSNLKAETSSSTTSSMNSIVGTSASSSLVGKPTVEVHPMPAESQPDNSPTYKPQYDMSMEKARIKPVVPKKPQNLVGLSLNLETSLITPLSISTSSLNIPVTPSSESSPSYSRLFSTPSMLCLHNAFMQSSLTDEELQKLEIKRQKLIESISRKVAVLDEEKISLNSDIENNELIRKMIVEDLVSTENEELADKLEKNLMQNLQILRLETKLKMHLERLESISNGDFGQKEINAPKIERLKRQVGDQLVLRKSFDRRDQEMDTNISHVLSNEKALSWRLYKETWKKLLSERLEIDERISLGKDQLNALQKTLTSL